MKARASSLLAGLAGLSVLILAGCATGGVLTHAPSFTERWIAPTETKPHGSAPDAQSKLLQTGADGTRTFALVLRRGDDPTSALVDFARAQHVTSAQFRAIGALQDPEVGYFDPTKKMYRALTYEGQFEALSVQGDIALGSAGDPAVHAHVVLGDVNGHALGGHLIHATVSPTLEIFVTVYPAELRKRAAPEVGLELIDPAAP